MSCYAQNNTALSLFFSIRINITNLLNTPCILKKRPYNTLHQLRGGAAW